MFFSATKHCKALPSLGLPKNTEQQLVLAVVVDLQSYAAVGQLLFSMSRHNNGQAPHVMAIKFVKHTTKQMCQSKLSRVRWVTQSVQMLTGGMAGLTLQAEQTGRSC